MSVQEGLSETYLQIESDFKKVLFLNKYHRKIRQT